MVGFYIYIYIYNFFLLLVQVFWLLWVLYLIGCKVGLVGPHVIYQLMCHINCFVLCLQLLLIKILFACTIVGLFVLLSGLHQFFLVLGA